MLGTRDYSFPLLLSLRHCSLSTDSDAFLAHVLTTSQTAELLFGAPNIAEATIHQ